MIHEKLYNKLELLITTEEGRKLAKLKSKPQNLQLIESLINDFSELIVNEDSIDMNRVTDMLTRMHEEMLLIYGRAD
jgi:hypothetical protein